MASYATGIGEHQNEFDHFMKEHNKIYNSAEEYEKRYSIWAQNKALIQRHNEEAGRGLHTYTVTVNQFSDMTGEEFKETMLTFKPAKKRNGNQAKPYGCSSLPRSVDWKGKGYVTEVGNQGSCGSCWAFTATGALEGQHKRKTGKLVDLSEQNLIDCSSKQGNQGCCGGMMDYSFEYVKVNGGIDTEKSYPYNWTDPKVGKCKYRKADSGASCTGYVDLQKGNETSLQCAIAHEGPIAIGVDASHQGFRSYKRGVYDDPTCKSEDLDFSLLVVGYGTENGIDYYNCKNDWGPEWGDHGYIKMVRNKQNQCGVASMASFPTM